MIVITIIRYGSVAIALGVLVVFIYIIAAFFAFSMEVDVHVPYDDSYAQDFAEILTEARRWTDFNHLITYIPIFL